MLECEVSWVKGVVDRSEDSGIGEFRVGVALKDKVGPFWKCAVCYTCAGFEQILFLTFTTVPRTQEGIQCRTGNKAKFSV